METRTGEDHATLLYDEKFDTWLNLEPLINLKRHGQAFMSWDEIYKAKDTGLSLYTIKALRESYIKSDMLTSYHVTPLVVSYINSCTLSGRSTVSNARLWQTGPGKSAIQSTRQVIRIQFEHMLSKTHHQGLQNFWDKFEKMLESKTVFPHEINCAFSVYNDFLKVLNCHKSLMLEVGGKVHKLPGECLVKYVDLPSLSGDMVVYNDLFLMNALGKRFLLSRLLFLEVFNKSAELLVLMMYSWFQTGVSMPEDHYQLTLEFHKYLAEFCSSHMSDPFNPNLPADNIPFVLLKNIEGLGVARLIEVGDAAQGWVNDLLAPTLWKGITGARIIDKAYHKSTLYTLFTKMKMVTLAELIGTVKVHGHPSIEIVLGINKLYERTHAIKVIDLNTRDEVLGLLIRDICFIHHKVKSSYPLIHTQSLNHSIPLQVLYHQRVDPTSKIGKDLLSNIPLLDWAKVEFQKNDIFDPIDNILGSLKDTASGFNRSQLGHDLYCLMENSERSSKQKRTPKEKKVLLGYLMDPYFDTKLREYLDKYENTEWDQAVLNYLVIKLTPKELEHKPEGRMFGSSPLEERMRRIIQEYNTSIFLDKFMPDQLLTPGELETLKKLLYFRTMKKTNPSFYVLNISFDFSAWNSTMRSEVVDDGAGKVLDSWFGVKFFSKTMQAYHNMHVYYKDDSINMAWDGQLGGIEGLNQPTWCVMFIAGVKRALERLNYRYQVTVKGDDVRAAIMIPKKSCPNKTSDLKKKQDDILESIRRICKDMGWTLNPQESFVSLSIIATSKQYLCNDTWLPTSAKKIMKLMSHSNMILCTLEDIVASIFSISHSACSQTTVVTPAYLTAMTMASLILAREFSNWAKTDDLTIMLLWAQVMGGPGVLPLQTFYVRGENDMLAINLSLFGYILSNIKYNHLRDKIVYILSQPLKPQDKHILLGDPYAIPIDAPPRPMSLLKRYLRRGLSRITKNPNFLAVLRCLDNRKTNTFKNRLISMDPYFAKVATCLWENSPFFLIEELLAKFCQSSTILEIIARGRSVHYMSPYAQQMMKSLVKSANVRRNYWKSVITGNNVKGLWAGMELLTDPLVCHTELTIHLRKSLWGFNISGITYPSLINQTLYFDYDNYVNFCDSLSNPRSLATHFVIDTHEIKAQTDWNSPHYSSIDGIEPWVGSRTSTEVEYAGDFEGGKSPTIMKLKNLFMLYSYGKHLGPQFVKLVYSLIKCYLPISAEKLDLIAPKVPIGHIAHRVPINSYSLNTCPNARPNLSQLVRKVDRDCCYPPPGDNYTINYAARHFIACVITTFDLQISTQFFPSSPTHLYAIFDFDHTSMIPDSTGRRKYNICPACCALIKDESLTMIGDQTHSELPQYHVKLIAASSSDKALVDNCISTIVINGLPAMIQPGIMVDAPLAEACAQMIISKSSSFMKMIHESYQIDDMRSAQMPLNLMLSLPTKHMLSGGSNKLSRSAWSDLDPRLLYRGILAYTFKAALAQQLVLESDITQAHPRSELIDHVTPIFMLVLKSGLLSILVQGFWYDNYDNRSVLLGATISQDAKILALRFLEIHWSQFINWTTNENMIGIEFPIFGQTKSNLWDNYLEETKLSLQWMMMRLIDKPLNANLRQNYWNLRKKYREIGVMDIPLHQKRRKVIDLTHDDNYESLLPILGVLTLLSSFRRLSYDELERYLYQDRPMIKLFHYQDSILAMLSDEGEFDFDKLMSSVDRDMIELLEYLIFGHSLDKSELLLTFLRVLSDIPFTHLDIDRVSLQLTSCDNWRDNDQSILQRKIYQLDPNTAKNLIRNYETDLGAHASMSSETLTSLQRFELPFPVENFMSSPTCAKRHCNLRKFPQHINGTIRERETQINYGATIGLSSEMILERVPRYPHPYVDLHKIVGQINHSQIKWMTFFGSDGLIKVPNNSLTSIGLIGDGSGGLAAYLTHLYPKVHIHTMSLRSSQYYLSVLGYDDYNPIPELCGYGENITSRVFESILDRGDILRKTERSLLKSQLVIDKHTVLGIICDADINLMSLESGPMEDHLSILRGTLDLATTLSSGGFIVYRTLITQHKLWWKFHYQLMLKYPHVHPVRPLITQPYSKELYIMIIIPPQDHNNESQIEPTWLLPSQSWENFVTSYHEAIKNWCSNLSRALTSTPLLTPSLHTEAYPMIANPLQLAEYTSLSIEYPRLHLCDFKNHLGQFLNGKIPGISATFQQEMIYLMGMENPSDIDIERAFLNLCAPIVLYKLCQEGDQIIPLHRWIIKISGELMSRGLLNNAMVLEDQQYTVQLEGHRFMVRETKIRRLVSKIRQYWWRCIGYFILIFRMPQTKGFKDALKCIKADEFTFSRCSQCRRAASSPWLIGGYDATTLSAPFLAALLIEDTN
ncbi:reverse transcriptase [Atrato Chu-like virus 5]|uniref:RNA-directed RNA polymerase n=1 Tax=Atrato Chu-like virus 5 TaxID=2689325 RepID=A0A6B9KG49_9VIRU|nr:reverse transcriptase [Atrato Chu-like virus 5]QHA33675.1 reverse transcriptase [Atrato Chu-like virus 5]